MISTLNVGHVVVTNILYGVTFYDKYTVWSHSVVTSIDMFTIWSHGVVISTQYGGMV